MKIHLVGEIDTGRVWLNGKELDPLDSQRVVNHSPDGFAWGYGGSGPAQLALAICLEIYIRETALKLYQAFKWKYIAILPETDFDVHINLPNAI